MRKILSSVAMVLALSTSLFAQRNCGSMEYLEYQKAQDPTREMRLQDIENFTNDFVIHHSGEDRAVVTIPVIVHVVWNTATENISDAQILSQIAVLNEDFRKLNSDASSVPGAFQSLAADSEIEFCMATVDPNGAATTGITRTQTSTTAFGTNDAMKFTAQGGKDAWPASQYLNIWVCDISGGILGYAQFPGGAASTDGVVIDYQYFGTTGTATAPFNKGRTGTHEVGHWLNLRHIWGDDGGACTGSDLVADTPNQGGEHYGCPTFPQLSCSNGANGDMFMNYMDYVDDACMYMFSLGQKDRMQALFATGGARASLLNSPGCGTAGNICSAPSGLSSTSVTASSATLGWSSVASAISYNLRYKATSATTWTTVNLTTNSYALSGLTSCTAYEFQVQSVCDATSSSGFSSSSTFTTTGCVATYCASAGTTTADEWINNVTVNTINNTSGNNNGYANYTGLSTTLAQGTTYNFSGTPGFSGATYSEFWRVWIDYNGDLDFLDAGEQVFGNTAGSTTTVTGTFTIPATATIGSTRMRVSMKYGAAPTSCEAFQYGEVEDYMVNIVAGVSCGSPTGLAFSGITQTGATATWAAVSGATSYSVQYKLNTATTWTTTTSTTTSYTIGGLTAGTLYNVRVAAICNGVTSAYSTQVNFTTTASTSCGTPTGLAVGSITQNSAIATWTAVSGATSYNVQYKLNTATTWTTVTSTTNSRTLTGLTAGTLYNVRVAAVCSGVTGTYSSQVNFTTTAATSCGTPTGLAVSSITQNSAVASWSAVSGATSYSVQYKLNSATTWTTVSSTATSYTITGLTAGTVYNARVAAVCSGTTGAYTSQVNFTTLAATGCSNNYEPNNSSTTATLIAVNTNITSMIATSSDNDYFRFTTTTAARNIKIDLTGLPADYDVRLYNPSGTQVGISQNGGTANETIIYNNGPVGTYRVRVYGYNGAFNSTSCYTLRANTSGTAYRESGELAEEVITSDAVSVPFGEISAFPNPTSDKLELRVVANEDVVINVQLIDMTGRQVYQGQMTIVVGTNSAILEMSSFAPGYYTVLLSDGMNRSAIRVIKE